MKRFEPSLLDKLFDDNPNGIDGPMVRSMSLDELKASVARDLEALLNTRMVFSGERLAGFPECTKSVLTYGLDDFSGLSLASDNDRKFICASIQNAITRHEPRLRDVKVELEIRQHSTNALFFAIEGLLVVQSANEKVNFDARLQPAIQQYSVTHA
jgi:type VI secretion system protein ImpF